MYMYALATATPIIHKPKRINYMSACALHSNWVLGTRGAMAFPHIWLNDNIVDRKVKSMGAPQEVVCVQKHHPRCPPPAKFRYPDAVPAAVHPLTNFHQASRKRIFGIPTNGGASNP